MKPRLYLDYNATTPLCSEAARAMAEAATSLWGNPSSVHAEGQAARAAVERARTQVAELVGARPKEITFTSGATESINWVHRHLAGPGRIITTVVEHPAVMGACQRREETGEEGGSRRRIPVDDRGRLDLDGLRRALEAPESIALVSVMLANNEIGNLYPVGEIAALCRERGLLCHTDATQAVGRIPVDLPGLGVDLASFSAHKLYGPKGVGALWMRSGRDVTAWMVGGHQERARRAGTENVPGIVGFGAAAAAAGDLDAEATRQVALRTHLLEHLRERIGRVVVNGDPEHGLPNTLNVSFWGCDAEALLMALDLEGVSVSAGSACSAGSLEPSHVLLAITDDPARQRSAIRFSLGRYTTADDVDDAVERLVGCVERIRGPSSRKRS